MIASPNNNKASQIVFGPPLKHPSKHIKPTKIKTIFRSKRAKKEKRELVYCANNDKGKTRRPFQ